MQTTECNVKDDGSYLRYVVHHHGECEGQAIWTIVQGHSRIEEVGAKIEDVEELVFRAMANSMATSVISEGVSFELDPIVEIMRELAFERLALLMEANGKSISLEQIIELEEAAKEMIEYL